MPTTPVKLLRCGAEISTTTRVSFCAQVTLTVSLAVGSKPFAAATSGPVVAESFSPVMRYWLRAGEGREVGSVLLAATLGVRRTAVEDEPDHGDDGHEAQGEDDDDLTAVATSAERSVASGDSWDSRLLVDCMFQVPSRPMSGVTGCTAPRS